jgi:hypothetical protein
MHPDFACVIVAPECRKRGRVIMTPQLRDATAPAEKTFVVVIIMVLSDVEEGGGGVYCQRP